VGVPLRVINKSPTGVVKVFCQNCGTEQPEDSQFCRKCGFSVTRTPTASATTKADQAISSESNQQGTAEVPQPHLPAAISDEKDYSSINFGTIVFASFSVLSLVAGLAKGIPIISVAETCVWAAAAIYWRRRGISSPKANLIVLLLAVCVAAGEGYSLGQSGSPNYTYLKEGNIQFRVDSRRGRTDRLYAGGWIPVTFDRPPEGIPADQIPQLVLSNSGWESATSTSPGQICFDVQNNSDYVLKEVAILAAVHVSTPPSTGIYKGFDPYAAPERVVLQSAYLIDRGTSAHLCGATSSYPSPSDNWSYSDTTASGWKQ
jgi:hypothetical protein